MNIYNSLMKTLQILTILLISVSTGMTNTANNPARSLTYTVSGLSAWTEGEYSLGNEFELGGYDVFQAHGGYMGAEIFVYANPDGSIHQVLVLPYVGMDTQFRINSDGSVDQRPRSSSPWVPSDLSGSQSWGIGWAQGVGFGPLYPSASASASVIAAAIQLNEGLNFNNGQWIPAQ